MTDVDKYATSKPAVEQIGDRLPRLTEVMRTLLAPGGCPWDREQTLESLRSYVIEEAHEVVEAIDEGSSEGLKEELGDLLLQIVFQSALAAKAGWFGLDDVVDGICDKMIRRHPHVFSDASANTSQDVLDNWEVLKAKEKSERGPLDGVPAGLPALLRAERLGSKAARHGYDWEDAAGVRAKLNEELGELDQAIAVGDSKAIRREIGDVLFAMTSLGRHLNAQAELCLGETLQTFKKRFDHVHATVGETGRTLKELDDVERAELWEQAKKK